MPKRATLLKLKLVADLRDNSEVQIRKGNNLSAGRLDGGYVCDKCNSRASIP